jgi:DoxX-like protein
MMRRSIPCLEIETWGTQGLTTQEFSGEECMQSATQIAPVSKARLWTGRILSGLVVAFLLMDGIVKLIKPAPVVEACVRLGLPEHLIVGIGIVLLACTVIYAIPRSSFFGAILLTGYLGGAVVIQLRVGSPPFETFFPVIFGVLVWAGLFLRDDRLRVLVSSRA